MIDTSPILDFLPGISDLLDAFSANVQHQPTEPIEWGADDPYFMEPEPDPALGLGTLVMMMVIGLGLSCLLGWWGKSRAEDVGINPWVGFAAGFFMGFIGVALVPLFRTDRVFVTRQPKPLQQPMQQNPMYAPGVAPQQQGYPQQQAHPQQPQPPQQGYAPSPGPQPHAHSMQPGYAPPPPPQPAEPAQMLVADEYGYVECPHCQSRTKAGRKSCMNCGNFLPPVFDPNIK